MKRTKKTTFNIDEDEAELFLSLKNAFSGLALEEGSTGQTSIRTSSIPTTITTTTSSSTNTDNNTEYTHNNNNNDNNIKNSSNNNSRDDEFISEANVVTLDHESYAQQINADDLAGRVASAFQQWEKVVSGDKSTDNKRSLEQSFSDVETEVICVIEAVDYLMNVFTSNSKKAVESLGKITDQYIKGWGLVETNPELRYRYCSLTDKLGAKWLDVLLEFSQLSVEKRTEWLNRFMQNWSHANGSEDYDPPKPSSDTYNFYGSAGDAEPYYGGGSNSSRAEQDEDFSYLDRLDESRPSRPIATSPSYKLEELSLKTEMKEGGGEIKGTTNAAGFFKFLKDDDPAPPLHYTPPRSESPSYCPPSPTYRPSPLKRGRSNEEMDEMLDYARREQIEDERDTLKRLQWGMVKNVQLMSSIRFELCKKCGMREDCLKIAQQMDDREKIVESRLMAGDADGDELENAMNSLLHL